MKKICAFVLLCLTAVIAAAQEQAGGKGAFNMSIDASLGLLHGQAEEIVYNGSQDKKLSQLLWDMKPLAYHGVNLDMDWRKPENKWGLFAYTAFKIGFPGDTGGMEDRDWAASDSAGNWLSHVLSHYSVHGNRTDLAFMANADLGVSFTLFDKYILRAIIGYDFMGFQWTATGGSFLYPTGVSYMKDPEAKIGTYAQMWHILSPGVSFYGRFNRFFDIDVSLKLSPFIWCKSFDEHLLRDLTIEDTMDFGFFIKPELVFSFTPKASAPWKLGLTVSYTYITGTRGDSEYVQQGQIDPREPSGVYANIGGAGYNAFDIGLWVRCVLID